MPGDDQLWEWVKIAALVQAANCRMCSRRETSGASGKVDAIVSGFRFIRLLLITQRFDSILGPSLLFSNRRDPFPRYC